MPKLIIDYLEKEVKSKAAGDKDVDIVDKDSTSYSIDGGFQLKKKPVNIVIFSF